MEKYTINDIARKAGVSKATVSRYINGKYDIISNEKKVRIQKVIDEVQFRPNAIAQGLANQNLKEIGVSIADISNPFSSIIIKGIFDECIRWGYSVNFSNSDGKFKQEKIGLESFLNKNINNLIVNTTGGNEKYLEKLENMNVVLVDRNVERLKFDVVTSDNYESVFSAIKYMRKLGYDKIIFLTEPFDNVSTRKERYDAYSDAVSFMDKPLVLIVDSNLTELEIELNKIRKDKKNKTGIFAVNGVVLTVLLNIMKKIGMKYPGDVGILSYEDWDWMEIINPGVSAIRQDSYGMGVRAAQMLLENVEKENEIIEERQIIQMNSKIIIRKSL